MRKHLYPLILILVTIVLWVVFYPHLPEQMPMQWGVDGSVNWTASRLHGATLNIGMMVILYPFMLIIPKLDPKRKGYLLKTKVYWVTIYSTMSLLFLVNIFMLIQSSGFNLAIHILVPLLIGFLFIIIGNYMQTVKPNWFMGIRTPWTLSSDSVWKKTHRFSGRLFMLGGLFFLIIPLLPEAWIFAYILTLVIITGGMPLIYSYLIYRKEEKNHA